MSLVPLVVFKLNGKSLRELFFKYKTIDYSVKDKVGFYGGFQKK